MVVVYSLCKLLVFLCFMLQHLLWVIPSGKVCKNADLQKLYIKGSKCLRESPRALGDLTVGRL